MASSLPKTKLQLRAIFGLARKRGLEEAELRDLAEIEFQQRSLSLLNFDQANKLITVLGGSPFPSGRSRRTEQLHRQRAGVTQIIQGSQLDLIESLARRRGWNEESLAKLCRRVLRGKSKPVTTVDANKVIEALKAMNARDAHREGQ